jgi:hypothetical protein
LFSQVKSLDSEYVKQAWAVPGKEYRPSIGCS